MKGMTTVKRRWIYKTEYSDSTWYWITIGLNLLAITAVIITCGMKSYTTKVAMFAIGSALLIVWAMKHIVDSTMYDYRDWHDSLCSLGEEAVGEVIDIVPDKTSTSGKEEIEYRMLVRYKSPIDWKEKEILTLPVVFDVNPNAKYACKVHEVKQRVESFNEKNWFGNAVADSFVEIGMEE